MTAINQKTKNKINSYFATLSKYHDITNEYKVINDINDFLMSNNIYLNICNEQYNLLDCEKRQTYSLQAYNGIDEYNQKTFVDINNTMLIINRYWGSDSDNKIEFNIYLS